MYIEPFSDRFIEHQICQCLSGLCGCVIQIWQPHNRKDIVEDHLDV